jgi:hypothetical protein
MAAGCFWLLAAGCCWNHPSVHSYSYNGWPRRRAAPERFVTPPPSEGVVSQSGAPLGVVLVVLYNLGVVLVGAVYW